MKFFSLLLWLVVNSMTTPSVTCQDDSEPDNIVTVINDVTEYESTTYCSIGSYCLDLTEEDDKFECKCDVTAPVCWMPEDGDRAHCLPTYTNITHGYVFTQPNN
ncbi:uncharacterized protein LOC142349346 [Convolutriloba macropyga]|uniref:uncharacterized protein LOC142349346 n=1 Tax=Convolutriloba macropyga TaxID=536237 RepID=UPI003F51B1E8